MSAPPVMPSAPVKPHKQARIDALTAEIKALQKQHNAVILAHLYERLEIQNIADHVGDSLGLSQEAARTTADVIVFCGVHFMAETAKLLSPKKRVFLGNKHAGCPMADMITRDDLLGFKAQHPGVPVVAYVNTTAEVKAESDVCCTSANAVNIVKAMDVPQVLFVPDQHLAGYVQKQLPHVEIIAWPGFCPTHLRIRVEDVVALKKEFPEAVIMAHPECDTPIKEMADFLGSTTKIREAAIKSSASVFIICTEDGVRARLAQDCPEKRFITPSQACAVCPNMKLTRLESLRDTLRDLPVADEIQIPEAIADRARKTLEIMVSIEG